MLKNKKAWFENRRGVAVLVGSIVCLLYFVLNTAIAAGPSTGGLVFILDASGSMETDFENRMKMQILKDTIIREIEKLPETVKVGVVVYGSKEKSDCEDVEVLAPIGVLGNQKIQILQKIHALEPVGMTPIANALETTLDLIARRKAKPTIILIADGQDSCLGDPCGIVQKRWNRGAGFNLNVIGFDVTRGAERQLECIAGAGGGAYYAADSTYALRTSLNNAVHNVVSPLSTSKVQKPEETGVPDLPIIELDDKDIWGDGSVEDAGGKTASRSVSSKIGGESTFVISMTGNEKDTDRRDKAPEESKPDEPDPVTDGDSVQAFDAPLEQRMVVVSGGRVRREPSLESSIKFLAPRGAKADVLNEQGDWFYVRFEDGRTGWSHKSLFGDADLLEGNFMKTIDVAENERGEEKVVFNLTGFIPPTTFFLNKGDPRVVCDFKDTRPMRTVPRKIEVNGELIKAVRTAVHKDSKFRVVLDLAPGKQYELAHLYSKRNNKYTLIVKDVE